VSKSERFALTAASFSLTQEFGGYSSSSKPPPFLDVLLSLSRNLRRASLKGSIAGISWSPPSAPAEADPAATSSATHARDTSVLVEADEDEDEEDDGGASSNVKRLAHDFDARSIGSMSTTGSDISEEDLLDRDRPRPGRTYSMSSQHNQRSRDETAEKAKRFERGLAEIDRHAGHGINNNFGHLVDTVHDGEGRSAWDRAVAEGGVQPVSMPRSSDMMASPEQSTRQMEARQTTIGLGIFDPTDERSGPIGTETKEGAVDTPLSPFISPPPAYTSPQFGHSLAEEGIAHALGKSDEVAIDHTATLPPKSLSYGSLRGSEENTTSRPRLPRAIDRRSASLVELGGNAAESSTETDTEDARDLGRRVTLRPARVLSAIFTPKQPFHASSLPEPSGARSGSVTPSQPHPSEEQLSRAHETINELQEQLRLAELEVARLELEVKEAQKPSLPTTFTPDERKESPWYPNPSNHQTLALLYGGLAGLCMSILVLKTFGRKAGLA
jgi:uncharacterized FlaG/YvyC family protein